MNLPDLPTSVAIDAYTGETPAAGRLAADVRQWVLHRPAYESGQPVMRPQPHDPGDWRDPDVGWGVILPDRADNQTSGHADAPGPIQELIAARGGKVLRYRPKSAYAPWTLREQTGDTFTPAAPVGMGPMCLPKYLLIYATPEEIPWHVQYALNAVRCVGRLDLTGEALENYVTRLLDDWAGVACRYDSPVVWAVDHGGGDITSLMRDTVAAPLHQAFAKDPDMASAAFIDGRATPATGRALVAALVENRPALIVTSSHGLTGPLSDPVGMRATMGLPVDCDHQAVTPEQLLGSWQPDGAIWFAQACCSAGSDSPTAYQGLFEPTDELGHTLAGIARAGAATAPLARALLGSAKPLRAFIGHVEPTFDWTLSFPPTGQALTSALTAALYNKLCARSPVGLAFDDYYAPIASLLQNYFTTLQDYEVATGAAAKSKLDMLLYSRVTAQDRASTVILGDPTVAIPTPG